MRILLSTAIVGLVFVTGYWYYTAEAVCRVPVMYHIGSIDSRFNLSETEAREAVMRAESVWEDATGLNLFTYSPDAPLSIDFIYDDRQESTVVEHTLRDVLETKEWMSDTVRAEYEGLLDEYEGLQKDYEARRAAYDARLRAHNAEVARWNEAGGAPEDIYANLNAHQKELANEQSTLNSLAYKLNQLVDHVNAVGAEGNALITDYNKTVETYNDRFDEDTEFAQGDYQGDAIHIYQYDSPEELTLVLAHEFGHALQLEHVENTESILYYLMDSQSLRTGLTPEDHAEFARVCGEEGFMHWLRFMGFFSRG